MVLTGLPFNQSCFKLVLNYSDIEECRQDCMVGGGDLASIHSKEENNFIQTLMKENLVGLVEELQKEMENSVG